eukprot:jgi/Hompol1/3818/HPOL_003364-RA
MLLQWGLQHGARIANLAITDQDFSDTRSLHRGALAKVDVAPGAEICFIPDSILLSESIVRVSPVGKAILSFLDSNPAEKQLVSDETKHPHAGILLAMSAFMVHELDVVGKASHWYPYLASLPQEYTLPLVWPQDRRSNLLLGTPLMHMIAERLEWIEQGTRIVQRACGQDIFPSGTLTTRRLLWAASAIWSRAFPKARQYKQQQQQQQTQTTKDSDNSSDNRQSSQDWISLSEICMYPILDMLNHKRGHKIEWRMTDQGVSFISVDGTLQGEELFNNYGPKGNENLLSNYGFVLQDNPEDYFKVFLALRKEDPLFERKQAILDSMGPGNLVHLVFLNDDIPERMIAVSRILVANEWELHLFETRLRQMNGSDSNESQSQHKAVDVVASKLSLRNEILAYATLSGLFEAKLSALIRPGADYDRDIQAYPMDDEPRRLARIYRDGQERILEYAIAQMQLKRVIGINVDGGDIAAWFNSQLISDSSPYVESSMHKFLDRFQAICEEDDGDERAVDEDTVLALIVLFELKLGKASHWSTQLHSIQQASAERKIALYGVVKHIEDHFDNIVRPLLQQMSKIKGKIGKIAGQLDDKAGFIEAACIVECFGVTVKRQWVEQAAEETEEAQEELLSAIVLPVE